MLFLFLLFLVIKEDVTSTADVNQQVLALYANSVFILYDSDLGDMIWKRSFYQAPEPDYYLQSFEIDPFNEHNLLATVAANNTPHNECLFAGIEEIGPNKGKLNMYQIYLANQNEQTALGSPKNTNDSMTGLRQRCVQKVGSSLHKKYNFTVAATHLLEYRQLIYDQCNAGRILVVFDRELHLIDINFGAILSVVRVESGCSNFMHVYSCWQRQMLMCTHASGTISVRIAQHKTRRDAHTGTDVIDVTYRTLCLSESLRPAKSSRIFGLAVDQVAESELFVLCGNGRLYSYTLCLPPIKSSHRNLNQDRVYKPLLDITPRLSDMFTHRDYDNNERQILLQLNRCMSPINVGACSIRMCPPLRPRNWFFHRPLLAVGDTNGTIQVFNVASNVLEREFAVHSIGVKGIEWVNLNQFLSFAYSTNGSRTVNELRLTELSSGRTRSLREKKNSECGPIDRVKVSARKAYFVLTFKHDPCEIWDLQRLCCLRQMHGIGSAITSIEWNPRAICQQTECFLVTTADYHVQRFFVNSNGVRLVGHSPQFRTQITATAWKAGRIVFGDVNGQLVQWDISNGKFKNAATGRGSVRKLMFAPGRESIQILVLFQDGVDVWDSKDMRMKAQLKHPRDILFKIEDVDWAAADRPILLTSDGHVLITDLSLKRFQSPLQLMQFVDVEASKCEKTELDGCIDLDNGYITSDLSPTVDTEQVPVASENNDLKNRLVELSQAEQVRLDKQSAHFNAAVRCEHDLMMIAFLDETERARNAIRVLHGKWPLKSNNELNSNLLQRCLIWLRMCGDLPNLQLFELLKHHLTGDSWLDNRFELFVNNDLYRRMQLEKLAVYESRRGKHEQNAICTELHLFLGNDQRAVQLLLETEPTNRQQHLNDSLKACLVSLLLNDKQNGCISSHPVVKLVATSLIANESLDEGVQLLFVIGKLLDACRYLQSSNIWNKSILLSKVGAFFLNSFPPRLFCHSPNELLVLSISRRPT